MTDGRRAMRKDWPDLIGGLALAAIGAAAAGWALTHYDLGSLRRMGPGFFPAALGAALAVLGLAVALPALWRGAEAPAVEPRAALAVLAAILLFGFALPQAGLALSAALSVLVATIPAPHPGRVWRLVLAVAIAALAVLVFGLGLKMSLPLWPTFLPGLS